MTEAEEILAGSDNILVVDWPSAEVPDTLAAVGYVVVVKGGPGSDDYSIRAPGGEHASVRGPGRAPEHVDVVYAHRPLDELAAIVELATALGARAIWHQSGRAVDGTHDVKGCWVPDQDAERARRLVEAAGLRFVAGAYIADVARQVRSS